MSEFLDALHLHRNEIDSIEVLQQTLKQGGVRPEMVVNGVDVSEVEEWGESLQEVMFIGCVFRDIQQRHHIEHLGAYVFPRLSGLPYDPYRGTLYSVDELLEGYDAHGYAGSLDFGIYTHFDRARRHRYGLSIKEALAQRLHDRAIDDALAEVLHHHSGEGVVGVMGGHGVRRDAPEFRAVAQTTWRLARSGYFVASGGGPGIMEAANLGAWLSHYSDEAVIDAALDVLSQAPKFDGDQPEGSQAYLDAIGDYVGRAREVRERFGLNASLQTARTFSRERPDPGQSLAVPTWFYGHEPTNLFGNHVAKYFSNSLREDGLLAISLGGVIYAPGSAGTYQEIFMDLAQNHYATFTWRSALVFLGSEHYASIFEWIQSFVQARGMEQVYGHMLGLCDTPQQAHDFVVSHPPIERAHHTPLYELL